METIMEHIHAGAVDSSLRIRRTCILDTETSRFQKAEISRARTLVSRVPLVIFRRAIVESFPPANHAQNEEVAARLMGGVTN